MQNARFALLSLLAVSFTACALPQRTFVASDGSDGNPCSITLPCRSFGTAVAAVTTGGEVLVLDSAGYGAVTITKSVSIIAPPGVYAGISAATADGVIVDGASIDVVLRGLTVNGIGATNGITFQQGKSLHVENCVVSGFASGTGINVTADNAKMHVVDTIVRNGQNGILFAGANVVANVSRTRIEQIAIEGLEMTNSADVSIEDSVITGATYNVDLFPIISGAIVNVTIARTLVSGGQYGVFAEPNVVSSNAKVTIMDSTIRGATSAGIQAQGTVAYAAVSAVRNQLIGNFVGLLANGASAVLIADANVIINGFTGMDQASGATLVTRGNNTVKENIFSDTAGTPFTFLGGN